MTSPQQLDQQAYNSALSQQGKAAAKDLEARLKMSQADIAARLKIAGMQSGDTQARIAAERDMNRERIAQMAAEMEKIGIPQMEINRFVAQKNAEIATAELGLKRDMFLAETAQKQAELAQRKREADMQAEQAARELAQKVAEMEKIGIPRVEIERFTAQETAKLNQQKQASDERFKTEELAQSQAGLTGLYGGQETLAARQAREDNARRVAELTGTYNGQQTLAGKQFDETQREYNVGQSGYMVDAAGNLQRTLSREELEGQQAELARRFGLDVGKFSAELQSTPDTYFQGQRFAAMDMPRLLGGAGAQTQAVLGGPTPGVARIGDYLQASFPAQQATTPWVAAAGGTAPTQLTGPGPTGPQPTAPGAPVAPAAPAPAAQPVTYARELAQAQAYAAANQGAAPPGWQYHAGQLIPLGVSFSGGQPEILGYHQGQPIYRMLTGVQQPGVPDEQYAAQGGTPGNLPPGMTYDNGQLVPMPGMTYDNGQLVPMPGMTYDNGQLVPISQVSGVGATGQPAVGAAYNDQSGLVAPTAGAAPDMQYAMSGTPTAAASSAYGGPTPTAYGGPTANPSAQSWMPGAQTDDRTRQIAAVARASPPSPYDGLNERDQATLGLMGSIYKQGGQSIAGGEYERLKASGRLGFLKSAGTALGYDPAQLEAQYAAYRPKQASGSLA